MAGWITILLTAVLVLITAYYAWQNRRMVNELAKTRAVSILPKLALRWHSVSPTLSLVEVVNVGPGPALDVQATVTFVPPQGDGHASADRRTWETSLLVPGEKRQFLPRDPDGGGTPHMARLAALDDRIELRGVLSDAQGTEHTVSHDLADIETWRKVQQQAHVRWQHPDPERRLARELSDRFEKPIKDAAQALRDIRTIAQRGLPRNDEDGEG